MGEVGNFLYLFRPQPGSGKKIRAGEKTQLTLTFLQLRAYAVNMIKQSHEFIKTVRKNIENNNC